MREWNGRYRDDQKRGGGLPGSSAEREEGSSMTSHKDINISLGVYRREDGEETVNTRKHMHNKTISGARGVLTQC